MDLIAITRVLLRRRAWVGLVAGLAIAAGVLVAYRVAFTPLPALHSREHDVGQATVRVLVDTPSSQVADLDPPIGSDALTQRAALFANLMATRPIEARIAGRLRIAPSRLLVVAPSTTTPPVPEPLAVHATTAVGAPPADHRLSVATDDTLPIITMDAQAPTVAQAAALANGAFVALSDQLTATADAQRIPVRRRPVVTALGGAAAGPATTGRSPLLGLAAGLLVLALGCAVIVVVDGLRRRWRERAWVPTLPPPTGAGPAGPANGAAPAAPAADDGRTVPARANGVTRPAVPMSHGGHRDA